MAVLHNGQVRDNKNVEIRPVCFKFLPLFMAGKEISSLVLTVRMLTGFSFILAKFRLNLNRQKKYDLC